jgi:hypothetical protein
VSTQKGTKRPWRVVCTYVRAPNWAPAAEWVATSVSTLHRAREYAATVRAYRVVRIEHRDNPGVPVEEDAS